MTHLLFPALVLAVLIAAIAGERLYRADPIVMQQEGSPHDPR